MEHGKPVLLPIRAGQLQGKLLGVRVKDHGKSECHAVMVWIGIEIIILPARELTSMGSLFTRESDESFVMSPMGER